jgi:predicted cupin superfamily sugar epimerase
MIGTSDGAVSGPRTSRSLWEGRCGWSLSTQEEADEGLSTQSEERRMSTLQEILSSYKWFDHIDGPKFVETHRNQYRTSGHWLFLPGVVSYFHKVLDNEELWLIHNGKLVVHLLNSNGKHEIFRLGLDVKEGERPVVAVPVGCWQAAEIPEGVPFAFGTNVCAPVFSYDKLVLADRENLVRDYPNHAELIARLTRAAPQR